MRTVASQFVRYLSTIANSQTDGELLTGFLIRNLDDDFAELVRRHGPMVWGVCRRSLPDFTDAEDAFQSVFLVLVQRGNRLLGLNSIGPWLHRVAVWTTRNVRRRNARRLSKRVTLPEELPGSTVNADLPLDIDAALMSLPDKVRSSIVLCHLLGCSRADAAARLGCAERTLSVWLSRGLEQLRLKLRGLDPVKTLSVAAVTVPMALSESVVSAATAMKTAAFTASVLSPTISQLVEGVVRMFWVKKATAASVALFAMFAFGVGIGVSTHQLSPAAGGDENVTVLHALKNVDQAADEEEIDLADLEKKIDAVSQELVHKLATARASTLLAQLSVKQSGLDPQEGNKVNDALTQTKQEIDKAAKELEALEAKLKKLKELKALKATENLKTQAEKQQPKSIQTFKAPQSKQDPDKQLEELTAQLRKLLAESELLKAQNVATLQKLKAQIDEVTASIAVLKAHKDKEVKVPLGLKSTGAYLQLTIGGKESSWAYLVKEFGPDGKLIGTIGFDNADVLGRYLSRTLKDASGPKELRIASQAGTTEKIQLSEIEIGNDVGLKDIVIGKLKKFEAIDPSASQTRDAQVLEALKRARETLDKTSEKGDAEGAMREAEKLLKMKIDELSKLRDMKQLQDKQLQEKQLYEKQQPQNKRQQKQDVVPPDQNESVIRELEKLLKMKQDELKKLKESEKPGKPEKPQSPVSP